MSNSVQLQTGHTKIDCVNHNKIEYIICQLNNKKETKDFQIKISLSSAQNLRQVSYKHLGVIPDKKRWGPFVWYIQYISSQDNSNSGMGSRQEKNI